MLAIDTVCIPESSCTLKLKSASRKVHYTSFPSLTLLANACLTARAPCVASVISASAASSGSPYSHPDISLSHNWLVSVEDCGSPLRLLKREALVRTEIERGQLASRGLWVISARSGSSRCICERGSKRLYYPKHPKTGEGSLRARRTQFNRTKSTTDDADFDAPAPTFTSTYHQLRDRPFLL